MTLVEKKSCILGIIIDEHCKHCIVCIAWNLDLINLENTY
jgi:hypothetical protein